MFENNPQEPCNTTCCKNEDKNYPVEMNNALCSISVFNAQLLQSDEIILQRRILNQLKLTPEIVSNHLKSLGEDKAVGPVEIGYMILKNCSHTPWQSIATLFQTYLKKGIYPTIWKTCPIIRIFKEGNKEDVNATVL